MKRMRKFIALLLAAIMVMAMGATAFADGTAKPTENDKADITVSNLTEGDTVKAYQIIKAKYGANGFEKYVWAVDFANDIKEGSDVAFTTTGENAVVYGLTSTNITAYAKTITDESTVAGEVIVAEGAASAVLKDLPAGTFLILVTSGDSAEVFNPMIASNYYTVKGSGSSNRLESKPVDANSKWTLATTNAYMKSSEPTITKKIVETNGNDKGNSAAFNGTVKFEVTSTVPSYSDEYSDIIYKITDKLSTGLVLDASSIKVQIDNADVSEGNYKKETSTTGYTLEFKNDEWIKAQASKSIVVTYSATLTEDANTGVVANTNDVTLDYTNDPSGSTNAKKDKTYTYSFEIDGNIYGKIDTEGTESWDEKTYELIKTDDGTFEKVEVNTGNHVVAWKSETETAGLAGATFTLTGSDGKVYTATTGSDGYMNFKGLAAGTYTLVETVAPDGYTINTDTHEVVISAKYNSDGTLQSYSVTIDGTKTNTYTCNYEGIIEVTAETKPTVEHTVNGEMATIIKNTKLSSLPSTGGVGTTIFTIGGVILMVGAAGVYFVSRRKKNA